MHGKTALQIKMQFGCLSSSDVKTLTLAGLFLFKLYFVHSFQIFVFHTILVAILHDSLLSVVIMKITKDMFVLVTDPTGRPAPSVGHNCQHCTHIT